MKPYENSSERLPIETFRKIIYNGFYYIKNNEIFWETNAIFELEFQKNVLEAAENDQSRMDK